MSKISELEEKYAKLGYVSRGNNLFLPLAVAKSFINDCELLGLEVTGIEFFNRDGNYVIPSPHIYSIRRGRTYDEDIQKWIQISCNFAFEVIEEEEKRDNTQYCLISLSE